MSVVENHMVADPWIGKKIGPCHIQKLIGEGAMGTVYLATHDELAKKVAVKILHPALLGGEKGDRTRRRFRQEAYWGLTLKHPNIVQVYKSGQENGTAYIVMEYVAGKSLAQILQEEGPRNQMETLQIAKEVVLALQAAHKKGVIHRDIKPANILIADNGDVKLSDFGLAKPRDKISGISHAGQIIGTIFYMSPEQAKGARKIDYRADFYALGATLFQTLTGQVPYPGRTPLQVLQQHISAPFPKMQEYVSGILPEVENLLARLMEKEPKDRFADAKEILQCIQSCQNALPRVRGKAKIHAQKKSMRRSFPQWFIGLFVLSVLFFVPLHLLQKMAASPVEDSSAFGAKIVEVSPDGSADISHRQVILSGKIQTLQEFSLWIDDEECDSSQVADGLWQFNKRLNLHPGENKVKLALRNAQDEVYEQRTLSLRCSPRAWNKQNNFVDFSLLQTSILDQNGNRRENFRPNEQLLLEIRWEIKEIVGEFPKILTIVAEGPGTIRPISRNLGSAKPESNLLRETISLANVEPGNYSLRISLIIGEVIRESSNRFMVDTPPKEVVRISLQPETITLRPREAFQFSVNGLNSWNVETPFSPVWIVSGGSIKPQGRYTAGEKTGDFIIVVRDQESGVQAKATVYIRMDSPPRNTGWFGEKMPTGMQRGTKQGEYIWEKDQSVMVYIPAGNFWRGSNAKTNERPIEQVNLEAFYIGKYEITWKQYSRFCTDTGHEMPDSPGWGMQENHPVVNISWDDANSYAKWAGKRLPTEVEWEKAAKGGFKIPDWTTTKIPVPLILNTLPRRRFPWGDDLPDSNGVFRCNYVAHDVWQQRGADGFMSTAPVGSFSQWNSPYGCADMAGNAWEWCHDIYFKGSPTASINNLSQIAVPMRKALRGGSWYNHAESCRTARREYGMFNEKSDFVGMRLVK